MIFKGQKNHNDDAILIIQEFIEANIVEKITVDFLAARCGMSRVNFARRFKKATQSAPLEYIHNAKVEAAKRSLEVSRKNINEVMYSVGYTDIKRFRAIFKKITGITPVEYKLKFGKN